MDGKTQEMDNQINFAFTMIIFACVGVMLILTGLIILCVTYIATKVSALKENTFVKKHGTNNSNQRSLTLKQRRVDDYIQNLKTRKNEKIRKILLNDSCTIGTQTTKESVSPTMLDETLVEDSLLCDKLLIPGKDSFILKHQRNYSLNSLDFLPQTLKPKLATLPEEKLFHDEMTACYDISFDEEFLPPPPEDL